MVGNLTRLHSQRAAALAAFGVKVQVLQGAAGRLRATVFRTVVLAEDAIGRDEDRFRAAIAPNVVRVHGDSKVDHYLVGEKDPGKLVKKSGERVNLETKT